MRSEGGAYPAMSFWLVAVLSRRCPCDRLGLVPIGLSLDVNGREVSRTGLWPGGRMGLRSLGRTATIGRDAAHQDCRPPGLNARRPRDAPLPRAGGALCLDARLLVAGGVFETRKGCCCRQLPSRGRHAMAGAGVYRGEALATRRAALRHNGWCRGAWDLTRGGRLVHRMSWTGPPIVRVRCARASRKGGKRIFGERPSPSRIWMTEGRERRTDRRMAESQLSELRNMHVLLEEARGHSRNLPYHKRGRSGH